MKTRRTKVTLSGGAENINETWTSFTYTDPAEGEADSISVEVFDRENANLEKALPDLGAEMTAKIETQDWGNAPGGGTLDCGKFIVDDFSFSGWPTKGTVSAVSSPADSSFRETEHTKTWKNVTVQEIGKEVSASAGIALEWDAGTNPTIKVLEQTEETDCSFFEELCDTYGLMMKIYASKLVVYDREAYKKKEAAATITLHDVESWDWKKKLAHTYTGGTYTYTISIKKAKDKKVKVTVGQGPRWLHKSGKADSKADAELKIKAALNKANHGATTMNCTMMGRTDLVATMCVNMEGFGKLSGKYYIDKVEQSVDASSGYTTSLEMSKCEEG